MSFLPLLGATNTPQQIMVMPEDHTTLCLTIAYHRAASFMAASQGHDWTESGAVPSFPVGKKHAAGLKQAQDADRSRAGPVEEKLFLSTCEPFDWQRLHTFTPSEALRTVRRAAHQLFVVDVLETEGPQLGVKQPSVVCIKTLSIVLKEILLMVVIVSIRFPSWIQSLPVCFVGRPALLLS